MSFAEMVNGMDGICASDLGETVTYTDELLVATAITGIFDTGEVLEGSNSDGVNKSLFAPASAFPTFPQKGETITVGSVVYVITAVEADACGGVELKLRKR